jgi:hypothetical protein
MTTRERTGYDIHDHITYLRKQGFSDEEIRQKIEEWAAKATPVGLDAVRREVERKEKKKQAKKDDRPLITITVEEHKVNNQAIAALATAANVYQCGGLLSRITRESIAPASPMASASPKGPPASRRCRKPSCASY